MSIGELQNFIESARRNKVPDAKTKERLESLGWDDKDIDEALKASPAVPEPVATPAFRTVNPQFVTNQHRSSSFTFVVIIIIIGALVYGVWHSSLLSTIFSLVPTLLPK